MARENMNYVLEEQTLSNSPDIITKCPPQHPIAPSGRAALFRRIPSVRARVVLVRWFEHYSTLGVTIETLFGFSTLVQLVMSVQKLEILFFDKLEKRKMEQFIKIDMRSAEC